MEKIEFRYEYKSKFLWAISFGGVLLLFIIASISFVKEPSVYTALFSLVFLAVIIVQIHAMIVKKIPFIEVTSDTIKWGYTGKKSNHIDFKDILEVVLNHGVDDSDIVIVDRSGISHKIHQIFFFTKADELKRILYSHQSKLNFKIVDQ